MHTREYFSLRLWAAMIAIVVSILMWLTQLYVHVAGVVTKTVSPIVPVLNVSTVSVGANHDLAQIKFSHVNEVAEPKMDTVYAVQFSNVPNISVISGQ